MGTIIQGVDSTLIVRNLNMNAAGTLLVDTDAPTVMFHVANVYRNYTENLAAPAGTYWVDGVVVPAGSIYIPQNAFMRNVQRAMAHPYMAIKSGGVYYPFYDIASLALNTFGVWQGQLTLYPGENISYRFVAVTLNDDIVYGSTGYIMTI
jgi:hypothetical protein